MGLDPVVWEFNQEQPGVWVYRLPYDGKPNIAAFQFTQEDFADYPAEFERSCLSAVRDLRRARGE